MQKINITYFITNWVPGILLLTKALKKNVFSEKTAKSQFREDMTVLRRSKCLATKINTIIFIENYVLNSFHSIVFWGKPIFSKITTKKILAGITIFEGKERRNTKMNITFSVGNGVPNTFLSFFFRKYHNQLNENRKIGFETTFSPISVILSDRLFLKTIGFIHGWIRVNSVNFMKIGSKLLLVYHKYISIADLWSGTFKMKSVTKPASSARPLLKSRVSE